MAKRKRASFRANRQKIITSRSRPPVGERYTEAITPYRRHPAMTLEPGKATDDVTKSD